MTPADTIFARAHPKSVVVEESFSYEQLISRNPSIGRRGQPTGRIVISLPYDGYEYFTRDARDDVAAQLRRSADIGDLEGIVGHLVLVDHQDTDLSGVLALDGRFGAYPLRLAARTPMLDTVDVLADDRYEHRENIHYKPSDERPELLPITLTVELADPDHADLLVTTDVLKDLSSKSDQLGEIVNDIKRFIGFQPFLRLEVTVRVTLPAGSDIDRESPKVRRVGVEIRTPMSLGSSSLELRASGDATVQHNPDNWNLEWFDVPMHRVGPATGQRVRNFDSPAMALLFKQPGELFALSKVVVEAEVEVPGELLSGTRVRLFDACGERYRGARDPLTVRSVLSNRCTVVLGDAFAHRDVSPYQHFLFDEIIPDPLRVADIYAALTDQRFTIVKDFELEKGKGKRELRHLFIAERTDGPDTMILLVYVEGRRRPTRRRAQQPSGFQYTSKFASGELRMYVRGQVRRDTSNLMYEINEFQRALRERFRRLKAHR